jgi:phospholipid transport system substrate-binding protein
MGKSVVALFLVAAATVSTASPREVVQRAVTRVVELLDGSGSASPGGRGGVITAVASVRRRAQIRAVADKLFDFEEVARRALSVHWAARTPAERTEFVGLFTDLLERAYLGWIESYAGEKIVYPAEKIDGDFAVVRSRIIPKRRTMDARALEAGLEYRLLRKDGHWKVYDRIIKTSSYSTLVDRLRGPEARVGPTERQ